MRHLFLALALSLCTALPSVAAEPEAWAVSESAAKTDSTVFMGRIENDEYQVYIVMDFYHKNITVQDRRYSDRTQGISVLYATQGNGLSKTRK